MQGKTSGYINVSAYQWCFDIISMTRVAVLCSAGRERALFFSLPLLRMHTDASLFFLEESRSSRHFHNIKEFNASHDRKDCRNAQYAE